MLDTSQLAAASMAMVAVNMVCATPVASYVADAGEHLPSGTNTGTGSEEAHTDATQVQYWWRYASSDCGYDDVPGQTNGNGLCQHDTVDQCKAICLNTTGCGGFNTHGILKKTDCLSHKSPIGSVDLYVLEPTPQPAKLKL